MRTIRTGVLVLGALLCLAACGGGRDDEGEDEGAGDEASRAALVGRWAYYATSWEENGSTETLSIGGDLTLGGDGQFEQNRRIGSVYNTASGTWSVEGDLLHLDSTFEFALGEDAQGATLTLAFDSDGTRYTYALRKAE